MIIDLSHPLEPGMPSYPGLPVPELMTYFTHAESAARNVYSAGTTFEIAVYRLGGNTGTYVDAPYHRHPDGLDLGSLPLERLVDLPGIVLDTRVDGPIDGRTIEQAAKGRALSGTAVLVRTGWDTRWGGPDYFRSGPYLTADACQMLVAADVTLVGIDCANIDNMQDPDRPAHTALLAAGIPIVEHLRGLEALPDDGFRFSAAPPAIARGTSFTVRAFAVTS
jgi:arylformamidase